jgi:D-beta-D-heptose 7-phosphate kinase/D-beta-D-heptose 1-phosphate adenosyltransferase
VSLVGDDPAGAELGRLVTEHGIDHGTLIVEPGRHTTEKVRIIAQHQQVVRADFETASAPALESRDRIVRALADEADRFDALVVSDYGKGVVEEDPLQRVIRVWRAKGKPVLVDPHIGHFRWYRGATIITPNTREAASFYGAELDSQESFAAAGCRIRGDLELDALLITRGEEGMSLYLGDGRQIDIPTVATEVYDVTGAGDTVISVLAAGFASGVPLVDAVVIANQAAGEVIKDLGTSAITIERLYKTFNNK